MHVSTPRRKAFTLVELLIVITIIGILVVALTPRLLGSQASARDAARLAAIQQIATALEFYADSSGGNYPNNGPQCVQNVNGLSQYMTVVPTDPLAGNEPVRAGSPDCSAAGGYEYFPLNGGLSYILMAKLENGKKTGTGMYNQAGLDFGGTDATDLLENSELCAGPGTPCDTDDEAVYITGR